MIDPEEVRAVETIVTLIRAHQHLRALGTLVDCTADPDSKMVGERIAGAIRFKGLVEALRQAESKLGYHRDVDQLSPEQSQTEDIDKKLEQTFMDTKAAIQDTKHVVREFQSNIQNWDKHTDAPHDLLSGMNTPSPPPSGRGGSEVDEPPFMTELPDHDTLTYVLNHIQRAMMTLNVGLAKKYNFVVDDLDSPPVDIGETSSKGLPTDPTEAPEEVKDVFLPDPAPQIA